MSATRAQEDNTEGNNYSLESTEIHCTSPRAVKLEAIRGTSGARQPHNKSMSSPDSMHHCRHVKVVDTTDPSVTLNTTAIVGLWIQILGLVVIST